jgi:hypothetical protein
MLGALCREGAPAEGPKPFSISAARNVSRKLAVTNASGDPGGLSFLNMKHKMPF